MDVNLITSLIGSFGFPIVACLGMAWYCKYTTDKNREDVAKITESHAQEMKEVQQALNNNTLAIQKLCDKLDR